MFVMLSSKEPIPEGFRLATVNDVTRYQDDARNAVTLEWGICFLADGKIMGPGYNYEVHTGSFFDLGHQLIVTDSCGNGKRWSNKLRYKK